MQIGSITYYHHGFASKRNSRFFRLSRWQFTRFAILIAVHSRECKYFIWWCEYIVILCHLHAHRFPTIAIRWLWPVIRVQPKRPHRMLNVFDWALLWSMASKKNLNRMKSMADIRHHQLFPGNEPVIICCRLEIVIEFNNFRHLSVVISTYRLVCPCIRPKRSRQ